LHLQELLCVLIEFGPQVLQLDLVLLLHVSDQGGVIFLGSLQLLRGLILFLLEILDGLLKEVYFLLQQGFILFELAPCRVNLPLNISILALTLHNFVLEFFDFPLFIFFHAFNFLA